VICKGQGNRAIKRVSKRRPVNCDVKPLSNTISLLLNWYGHGYVDSLCNFNCGVTDRGRTGGEL